LLNLIDAVLMLSRSVLAMIVTLRSMGADASCFADREYRSASSAFRVASNGAEEAEAERR
jgi:hypothetical protein